LHIHTVHETQINCFCLKKDTGLGLETEKKPSVMQLGSCNQHFVKQPLTGYYGEIGKQNVLRSPSYTSLNLQREEPTQALKGSLRFDMKENACNYELTQ